MSPGATAVAAPAAAPVRRHRAIEALMRVLFRPVFGWRDPQDHGAQQLTIPGLDRSRLALARVPAATARARGVVLLCHPFMKYGKSYFLARGYPQWLSRAGWHVAAFDFKGFGRSTLGGICFADDVKAASDWARQQYPGLPLHLVGASFGAFHGIHAVARHGSRFSSAVFDSVPMTIASYFDSGPSGAAMRWISRSAWARPTSTHDLAESLPATQGLPSLYLYGGDDRYVRRADLERLRSLCPHAEIRVFDGCGHLEIRKRQPDAYIEAILGFLETHNPAPMAA